MKRSGLFRTINSHPALLLGAGIIVTGSVIYSYRNYIRPVFQRRKFAEAEGYAEYLFEKESKQKMQTSLAPKELT
jgi:hypothetical protein